LTRNIQKKKEQDGTLFGVLRRWFNPFHWCNTRRRENNVVVNKDRNDIEVNKTAGSRGDDGKEVINRTTGSELDGTERATAVGNTGGSRREEVGELHGGEGLGARDRVGELDSMERGRGREAAELEGAAL
jgi:hypothetical protein